MCSVYGCKYTAITGKDDGMDGIIQYNGAAGDVCVTLRWIQQPNTATFAPGFLKIFIRNIFIK